MEWSAMTTRTLGASGTGLLGFAATPAFALMALLTALPDGAPAILCGPMHAASPLAGMTWMYLLMSVFHSAPWLRLIAARR
jgi:hypothetical protein